MVSLTIISTTLLFHSLCRQIEAASYSSGRSHACLDGSQGCSGGNPPPSKSSCPSCSKSSIGFSRTSSSTVALSYRKCSGTLQAHLVAVWQHQTMIDFICRLNLNPRMVRHHLDTRFSPSPRKSSAPVEVWMIIAMRRSETIAVPLQAGLWCFSSMTLASAETGSERKLCATSTILELCPESPVVSVACMVFGLWAIVGSQPEDVGIRRYLDYHRAPAVLNPLVTDCRSGVMRDIPSHESLYCRGEMRRHSSGETDWP